MSSNSEPSCVAQRIVPSLANAVIIASELPLFARGPDWSISPSVEPTAMKLSVPWRASPEVATARNSSVPAPPNWVIHRCTPLLSIRDIQASRSPLERPSRSPSVNPTKIPSSATVHTPSAASVAEVPNCRAQRAVPSALTRTARASPAPRPRPAGSSAPGK